MEAKIFSRLLCGAFNIKHTGVEPAAAGAAK